MHNNYPVIVKTYELTKWMFEKLSRLPKNHRFTLGETVQNVMLDILMILSDAVYAKEKRALLQQANRELEKLRLLVRLMGDLSLMPEKSIGYAMGEINAVGGQIGGWLRSV